jgi:hypothetical protein
MVQVRRVAGLRPTSQACQPSAATAVTAKNGRSASSHSRQPALAMESAPSPARTCGSSHQLGTRRAATVETIPAEKGVRIMGVLTR